MAGSARRGAKLWARHGVHYHRRLSLESTAGSEASLTRALEAPPGELGGMAVVEATRTDGLKLRFADGSWCLLRRSGTEPLLRIYVESGTEAGLERLVHGSRELLAGR